MINEPIIHHKKLKYIAKYTVYSKDLRQLSKAGEIVQILDEVTLLSRNEFLLVIEFDDRKEDQAQDFRPVLPLVFHW
ncbi:hypothetical protein [Leptospira sarikeiensis]|uniref:Uncharacterized protein n=1 Tax=Leptospira sarikeiensis TaxID=2484943 RepID=A0A4R9K177_9LEPT|nr:hypothetical protein [Leptospira sarikeiensis]TGL58866.1 hypothetical protein EHQ64_17645 [Leptospira sarikeiensis]